MTTPPLPSRRPMTWPVAMCVLAMALAACGSDDAERHHEYAADLAPHSATGPVELKLLALREGTDAVRLRVRLDNRSGTPVELKAADWQARWASVRVEDRTQVADVSVPVDDPDDRWPDERPLRRDAEVAAYRSSDFLIDSRFSPPLSHPYSPITLMVRISQGGAPLTLTLEVPAMDQPR